MEIGHSEINRASPIAISALFHIVGQYGQCPVDVNAPTIARGESIIFRKVVSVCQYLEMSG